MKKSLYKIKKEISSALLNNEPIVALESAVITHGLPQPINLNLARELEDIVRQEGAIPATIALLVGSIHIGLTSGELESLASAKSPRKISRRDFGLAIANHLTGGTTVAGTIFAASQIGIKVFATGGIGGVHRHSKFDISADLQLLANNQLIVVCAGAKAILDLPATLEVLETLGVPVIGYRTDEFPAFYSSKSGLGVDARADTPEKIAQIALSHWDAGINGSILVVVPPPQSTNMNSQEVEIALEKALTDANQMHIHGSAITPFLLQRMGEITNGKSLQTNLDLLKNNAKVASRVAKALVNLKSSN